MPEVIVYSEVSLQTTIGLLREDFKKHKRMRLNWVSGKSRSLDQNALSWAWYDQIARELPEDRKGGWRRYCKLHHGVPILRVDDAEFRDMYDRIIRPMQYEDKLELMDILPVTSRMTTTQLSIYLDNVKEDFRKRGVILEYPEEQAA